MVPAFDYPDPDTLTRCGGGEILTSFAQILALRPICSKSFGCLSVQVLGASSLAIQSLDFSSKFGRLLQQHPVLVRIGNTRPCQLDRYLFKFLCRDRHGLTPLSDIRPCFHFLDLLLRSFDPLDYIPPQVLDRLPQGCMGTPETCFPRLVFLGNSVQVEISYREFFHAFLDRIQRLRGRLQDGSPCVILLPLFSESVENKCLTHSFEQIQPASDVRQERFAFR